MAYKHEKYLTSLKKKKKKLHHVISTQQKILAHMLRHV